MSSPAPPVVRARVPIVVRAIVAAVLSALLLGSCAWPPVATPDATATGAERAAVAPADERMPRAPRREAAWLAAVDRAYDDVGGLRAERWLHRRMARRRPGERPAVLMGIDDVMLRTHFDGLRSPVPRSVHVARTAHALGYAVFYLTGRPTAGLRRVEASLRRAGAPADGFCGRPAGMSEEAAKARCRAALVARGYTLALDVAASEASFDGRPLPQTEIRLPAFGPSR